MEETVLEWNGMEEGKETRKKLKIEKQAKETEEKANKIKENEKSIAERKRRQSNLDKAKLKDLKLARALHMCPLLHLSCKKY